jgi:hypothetical protein
MAVAGAADMKNGLAFEIPFSGFAATTFINCFASVYVFLEAIATTNDFECKQRDGKPCDGCGNCRNSPAHVQEKYFFLFDTMCGRSSLRCRFDGAPSEMQTLICETDFYDGGTDYTVDFLFGFAGYNYRKLVAPGEFKAAIVASIDAGRPVIAKVKTGAGRFRVITGYDGDALRCPDFTNAQEKPQSVLAYDELDRLYVVDNKAKPRYTLEDGLERVQKVMEYNVHENLWDAYIEKMGLYTADSLGKTDLEEKKARMKRVADTMWHTFNSHNFAEVFRNCYHEELRAPALDKIRQEIGGPCYGYTHDLAWALIGLEERADWSRHYAGYFGEMVGLTLSQIKKNDTAVLDLVKRTREILRQQHDGE